MRLQGNANHLPLVGLLCQATEVEDVLSPGTNNLMCWDGGRALPFSEGEQRRLGDEGRRVSPGGEEEGGDYD